MQSSLYILVIGGANCEMKKKTGMRLSLDEFCIERKVKWAMGTAPQSNQNRCHVGLASICHFFGLGPSSKGLGTNLKFSTNKIA